MDHQFHYLTKDRARMESILQNPPVFSDDDIQDLLACCLTPPPTGAVQIICFSVRDAEIDAVPRSEPLTFALAYYLSGAFTEFLINQTLESERPIDGLKERLKLIQTTLEKFIGVIGLRAENRQVQIPWPISKRILIAMGSELSNPSVRRQTEASDLDAMHQRIARCDANMREMAKALTTITSIAQWTTRAVRQEKSRSTSPMRYRNLAFENLVRALALIWQKLLSQDLTITSNANRNLNRWAPMSNSFERFSLFFQKATTCLGVEFSNQELSDTLRSIKNSLSINSGPVGAEKNASPARPNEQA